MIHFKFLFFFLGFSLPMNAQKYFSGVLSDSLGMPIPYCTIGYLHHEVGTYSDINGNFSILLLNDTIKISVIGYYDRYILPTITNSGKLILANKPVLLPEVKLTSTHYKHTITVGYQYKNSII
jgi:hypothetical protein